MAEPRKVFRIEQTAADRLDAAVEGAQAGLRHAELMQQLRALQAMLTAAAGGRMERPAPRATLPGAERITSELSLIHEAISGEADEARPRGGRHGSSMTRIAHELDAVVNTAEQATQRILAAAEEIDQAAGSLAAALKGKHEQGLAQDIQDLVIKIFEACNFQDLAGQRVAKVLATMNFVEEHITRVLDEIKRAPSAARLDGTQYLHGPRLDFDGGHATQDDIDVMFADD